MACFLFNILGLGGYYILCLVTRKKCNLENPGTVIFWGFLTSLLFTYVLWVLIPSRLDIGCYLTVAISVIGVGLFLKREKIRPLLLSNYSVCLLCLLPFIFFVEYSPHAWDEFSHWLIAPKVFYHHRTLAPETGAVGMLTYTPLWTLQSAFFQFFTLTDFSESIIYAVRINFFLAFLFFIKEITKLRFAMLFLLTFCIIYVSRKYAPISWYLTIEFPMYLLITSILFLVERLEKNQFKGTPENIIFFIAALLAGYMIKQPLIALVPAGVLILWINGYKKQLFYFLFLFFAFYISWKLKASALPGRINFDSQVNLWGLKAVSVYKEISSRSFNLYFVLFVLNMATIFWKNKNVFVFCLLFSFVYFLGTVFAYIYVSSDYEAASAASYERYISVLLIPIFIFSVYIVLMEIQKWIDKALYNIKYIPRLRYIFPLLMSVLIGGSFFYHSLEKKHFLLAGFEKIKNSYDLRNKNIIAIAQGGTGVQYLITAYAAYEYTKNIDGGSFGSQHDNLWRTVVEKNAFIKRLKDFDVILVLETDAWLNDILLTLTNKNQTENSNFAYLKKENNYELLKL